MQPTSKKSLSVAQVYVIQNELGLVKIGFANKPDKRIDSIAANSGLKIVNRHVSPPCFNFTDVEKQLHQHFSHARKHGEWFDLPFEIAVDALNAHFTTPAQSDNQALAPFQFENHAMRTVVENDQIWFVAKDVCDILEIVDFKQAISRLDDDERGGYKVPTPGGLQETNCINESGLYALVLRSNKPQAKAFRKWITNEVLPSIRKTGGYGQCILTPEFQSFIRATVANEVNTALESKTKPVSLNKNPLDQKENTQVALFFECLDTLIAQIPAHELHKCGIALKNDLIFVNIPSFQKAAKQYIKKPFTIDNTNDSFYKQLKENNRYIAQTRKYLFNTQNRYWLFQINQTSGAL